MQVPNPEAVLTASHLEELEAKYLAQASDGENAVPEPPPAITLQDAVDALRRIRYHREQIARIQAEADALIAPLQAQIDQIRAWAQEQIEERERRIRFHEARLVRYYIDHPPARGKTLRLPGGAIFFREQQPEFRYDDAALLNWLRTHRPEMVRVREEPDKAALRKVVEVRDGRVVLADSGEVVDGVEAIPRPPVFKVEVAEDAG